MPADPAEVLPYLYLGSRIAAADRALLAERGITHVLNAATEIPNYHADPGGAAPPLTYLQLELQDSEGDDIAAEWQRCTDWIRGAHEAGGKVLVHCQAGISRSAAIVIAYLMMTERVSLRDAYTRVKQARSNAGPNMHFMRALGELEDSLRPEGERGAPPTLSIEDTFVNELVAMGFAQERAERAARESCGRWEMAVDLCLSGA
eukprot:TRINITY_DN37947_c0_g1_i1.p1 TRINITY_DN37947_c0_g1~~TRINITY_DN37947_c0_g1_i1.p1  ORF type:complete len:227 (+),score=78.88 TRINITY_DN37947_c0_g1_i1:71-682(+)